MRTVVLLNLSLSPFPPIINSSKKFQNDRFLVGSFLVQFPLELEIFATLLYTVQHFLSFPTCLAPPESHSRLAPRHELSSPVTSDEEYLSPLEEFPESGTPCHHPVMKVQPRSEIGPAPAHTSINFKAAPSFEVRKS